MDKLTHDLAASLRAVMTGEKAAIASASEVLKAYDNDLSNLRTAAMESMRLAQQQLASLADTLDRLRESYAGVLLHSELTNLAEAMHYASKAETYLARSIQ